MRNKTKILVATVVLVGMTLLVTKVFAGGLNGRYCSYDIGWQGEKICLPSDCTSGSNCGTLWTFYDCSPTWEGACGDSACDGQSGPVVPSTTKSCKMSVGNCICDD